MFSVRLQSLTSTIVHCFRVTLTVALARYCVVPNPAPTAQYDDSMMMMLGTFNLLLASHTANQRTE